MFFSYAEGFLDAYELAAPRACCDVLYSRTREEHERHADHRGGPGRRPSTDPGISHRAPSSGTARRRTDWVSEHFPPQHESRPHDNSGYSGDTGRWRCVFIDIVHCVVQGHLRTMGHLCGDFSRTRRCVQPLLSRCRLITGCLLSVSATSTPGYDGRRDSQREKSWGGGQGSAGGRRDLRSAFA